MTSLTYLMPGWWPLAAGAFAVVALVGGWIFVRGTHPYLSQKLRAGLWTLRIIAGLLLLACLLDWRQETVRHTDEKPLLRVVIDKSASMATKDAASGKSRYEASRDALAGTIAPTWNDATRLETGFAGNGFSQGDPATTLPDVKRSALGGSLREALENQSQQALGGVILLTDGAASDAAEMRAAAKLYQAAHVPVFPWVIGTTQQPNDLRIVASNLQQPSPSQSSVHLDLEVGSPGYEGKESTLSVRFGTQVLLQQTVKLTGAKQSIAVDFLSPYRGCHFYDIELSPLEGEASTANNRTKSACDVRREPIRVLYMEGSAPPESAYLREGLEVDPQMEVTCLHFPQDGQDLAAEATAMRGKDTRIFQDGKGRPVPSVCHPTRGFPTTLENLLKYDVIIDSDIVKEAFSPEQMAWMVAFVEEFGGGFSMVGGQTSFGAGGYEKTVIDKLMPVEISNHSDPFWRHFPVKVTDSGLSHPMMRVGKDLDETKDAWTRRFPGFDGANYAKRAKPGAHVLARISLPGTPMDDLVVFAVQQIGRGRTMAFMPDTTSSWGTSFETRWPSPENPEYYRKFWNNTIRWLASDRIARKGGQAELETPHAPVMLGETANIRLAALSTSELAGLEVTVREGDQAPRLLPLQWNGATRHWEGPLTPKTAGEVMLEARYKNPEGTAVTTRAGFFVRTEGDESVAVAIRPDLMEALARETGGKVINEASAGKVLNDIAARSVPVVWKRAIPVWDRWWILLPLLFVIVAEWLLRRRREPARLKLRA